MHTCMPSSLNVLHFYKGEKMKECIVFITNIINVLHDGLIYIFYLLGFSLSDKKLHFWIIGIIGLLTFLSVYMIFKLLSKWKFSITAISFIYTLTVMLVLVFAIEIQQGITTRGNMEFDDAIAGLWGFLVFFSIYIAFASFFLLSKRLLSSNKEKKIKTEAPTRSQRHVN